MNLPGNPPVVQWSGLSTFTAGAWVQSLMEELRSQKPQDVAKKKKRMNLSRLGEAYLPLGLEPFLFVRAIWG